MQYVQQKQLLTTDNLYPSLCSNVACWFWQAKHIQSYNSAAFSSYVTTTGTRGRTNIKPQDPGEPKEPFGLVIQLLLHIPYPPLFFLDYCLFSALALLLFFVIPFVLPLSACMLCLPPSPYLHIAPSLPLFS